MTRERYISTPDQIVRDVIADARLEGQMLDPETIEVVRRIAYGEMTDDEIKEWQQQQVEEILAQAQTRD